MPEEQSFKHAPDPLIDEVRTVRRELSDQFENNVFRLGEYLQKVETEHEARRKAAAVTDAESK